MLFFKDPDIGKEIVSGQTLSSRCSINRVEQNSEVVLKKDLLAFAWQVPEVDEFSKKSKNTSFSKKSYLFEGKADFKTAKGVL